MPPFQSRSTGAASIAEMSWSGGIAWTAAPSPSARLACGDTGTDLAVRGHTPPPAEISAPS